MNRGFRVYDKQDKEMINKPSLEMIYLSSNGNLVNIENYGLYLMDRYVRMDSTGLLDKNNKEIYEGDIIHMVENIFHKWVSFNAVIEYQAGSFWYRGLDYNITDCNWHHYNPEDREVIGNIYENPELVKP